MSNYYINLSNFDHKRCLWYSTIPYNTPGVCQGLADRISKDREFVGERLAISQACRKYNITMLPHSEGLASKRFKVLITDEKAKSLSHLLLLENLMEK